MTIADAARSTRKHAASFVYGCGSERSRWAIFDDEENDIGWIAPGGVATQAEAQAACDRMNLLAVLDALREPREAMVAAADDPDGTIQPAWYWRTMIDALIAEVKR